MSNNKISELISQTINNFSKIYYFIDEKFKVQDIKITKAVNVNKVPESQNNGYVSINIIRIIVEIYNSL